jgi:hypothetical protein
MLSTEAEIQMLSSSRISTIHGYLTKILQLEIVVQIVCMLFCLLAGQSFTSVVSTTIATVVAQPTGKGQVRRGEYGSWGLFAGITISLLMTVR